MEDAKDARKTGRPAGPGAPREGSLVSKLLNIKPGETIYFPDRESGATATHMERSIQDVMAKSPHLSGRRFSTERWVAIQTGPLRTEIILAVTRTQ